MSQDKILKKKVLITGANGRVGKLLQKELSKTYDLRLADIEACDPLYSKDIHTVDILKPQTLPLIMKDVYAVIHLAAIADEIEDSDKILTTNILGTKHILEVSRQAQVPRFILASSIHAVGFYPRTKTLTSDVTPRPSGFYGVSKVASEALVRLYADKYGLSCICLRINSLEPKPQDKRQLTTWLSEPDAVKLFKAAIEASLDVHFEIIYGVSNNTRKKILNPNKHVLFKPTDDAELYHDQIEKHGIPEEKIAENFHGGPFAGKFFGGNLTKTLDSKLDSGSASYTSERTTEENPPLLQPQRSKL